LIHAIRKYLKEQLVERLDEFQVLEFFVHVASEITKKQFSSWNTIILEIFFLIFCSIKPNVLSLPASKRGGAAVEGLLAHENFGKVEPQNRHSRFSGTFSVQLGVQSLLQ
jgi:replication fork protection complex subunit Tof1/Swi1